MKNSKLSVKLLLIILLGLIYHTGSAQTEYEKRQKTNKENEEHLKRVYENNLPNARGSSVRNVNVSEDIRIAKEAAQQKEYEIAQKQAEYEQIKEDYKAYVAEKKTRHEQRVEAIRNQQEPFMRYLGTELRNINIFDKADWYTDHLFIMIEGPKVEKLNRKEVKELDYAAASTAIVTFDAVKAKATYEELASLLDEGKLLFHSTRTRIAYLYERFPEQTNATELLELSFLPYYFGANRSFLTPAEEVKNYIDAEMYYPLTYFETGSRNENKEIAARFVTLTNKYPKEGLAAANKARIHLNPFVSYAQSLNSDDGTPEKIIELKNENYWRAIYSASSEKQLKEAFSWLNSQKNMKAQLEKLTPQEWLQMGNVYDLSHLQVTFFVKGMLGGEPAGYNDILSNKYKKLKKAVAIKNKEK